MQQKEQQQDKLAGGNGDRGATAATAIEKGMGTFETRPADGYGEDNGSGVEQQRDGDSGLRQEQQDAMQRSGTFEAVVKIEDREEDHHAPLTGAPAAAARMPLLKQESSSFTLTGMPGQQQQQQVAEAKPAAAAVATAITPLSDSPALQSHAWHQQQLHDTPAHGHPVVHVGAGPLPGQPGHGGDDHIFSQDAGKKEEDGGDGAGQRQRQGQTGQYGDVIIPQRIQAYAKLEFPFFNFYIQKLSVTIGRRPPVSRTTTTTGGTGGSIKEEVVHQPHEAGDVVKRGNGVVKSEPVDDVEPLSLEPPLLEPPTSLNGSHAGPSTAHEGAADAEIFKAETTIKPEPGNAPGDSGEAASAAVTPEDGPGPTLRSVGKEEADPGLPNIESGRDTLERFSGNKVMVDVDLGPIKAVSRDHARLFFDSDVNPATGCSNGWSLEVKGRNGLVLNERWRAKGEIVRVANRSRIQIAERIFHFILPNGVPYPTASLSPSYDDGDSMYGSTAESEDEHRQSPARSLSPPLVYGSDSDELRSSDGGQPVPAASPPRYGQGKGKGKGKGSLEHLKKKAAAAAAKKLKKNEASTGSRGNESESPQSSKRELELEQSASFEISPQGASAPVPDAATGTPTAGLPHAPIPYASNSKKQLKLPGAVTAPAHSAPAAAAATATATPAALLPIWFNGVDLARQPEHSLTKKQKTELGKVRRQRDKEEKAQLREKERLEKEAAKQLKKEQKVKEDAEKRKKEAEKQQKKLEEANEIRNRSREEKEKAAVAAAAAAAAAATPATNGASAGTPQVAGMAKPASSLDSGPSTSSTAPLPPLPPLPPTPAASGNASQPPLQSTSANAPKPAMTMPIQPISTAPAPSKPKPEVSLFLPNKGLAKPSPALATTSRASSLGVAASSPGATPSAASQSSSSRANDIPVVLPSAPLQAAPAQPPAVPASAQKAAVPPPPVKKATPKPVPASRPPVPSPQPHPQAPTHFVPTNQFQYKPDKPPYSYAALIAQAIYSTPAKQASVQHIHAWIPERYPFFRENGAMLQTAIKQNLAVNRAFLNIPQPTGAALWAVEPEHARVFDGNTFLAPVQAEPAPTPSVSRHASPPAHHASRTVTHSPSMSPAPPSFAAAASAAGPAHAPAASTPAPASASTSAAGGSSSSRVPILIAPLPASYPKPAPAKEANAMLDPNGFPPIAIHEGRMYLSPPIFSTLTAQQLSNLQSIETKQALNILQAFVVNYFKVELKKRKKAEKAAAAAAAASGTPAPAKSQTPGTKRPAEGTPDGANKQQKVS